MDNRPPLGVQRPLPPQRTVSGSYALQSGLKRAPQPSRLNNVRSVSHPINVVDLTADGMRSDVRNTAAFLNNADKVYTSPDVINLDEDDNDRPTKRAKTSGHGLRTGGGVSEAQRDAAHKPLPGLPLASLPPCKTVVASRNTVQRSRRAVVDRAARRANGLEPPSIATRLPPPRHVADFHPWNGHHAEDILTETVVKSGYYDKPPGPNAAETSSAKPTIWSNLSAKNNMGLQTLSYLFTSVMEKRQAMGKVTAQSTFKPPPRVTVTDTKREAWLRDLANPDVPLRKQSRTIPHGVRGKLLMEQCLGKNIPMARAVWLAKCVGANELRAFRRKGVSGAAAATGENKWVREWTVSVEQFLEGVIATCGQPLWQSRMDYAVKLATSFYSERLLEREHYLDWIVSSFAQAIVERLPIWLILTQLYWKDITAFGRRGRQLAEATLETLHQISQSQIRVNDTLKARLQKLVMILAVTNRGCLILPKTWQKYAYLLAPKTLTPNTPAQNIMRRNARLVAPILKTPQNTRCPLLRLYSVLDSVALQLDVEKLSSMCLAIIRDIGQLVAALLNWSASVHRPGLSRVYVAAQVISQLRKDGQETDGAILGYLGSDIVGSVTTEYVHRVLVELIRKDCFSAGRYMQWLISSGVLYGPDGSPMATGLLAILPQGAISPNLLNTRHNLMNRLKMTLDEEEAVSAAEHAIVEPQDGQAHSLEATTHNLSTSGKLELAARIATRAVMWAKNGSMSLLYFCSIREVLELANDLQALASTLEASIYTDDTALLATICDTISMHGKAFAAIGCLQSMVERVSERYRVLRAQQPPDRAFILALTVLLGRFPEKASFVKYLDNDLAVCDQQNALAVCSPASDNIISMQASNLESDHDIDAVFASGNTMDEQLMQRVFSRIVQRASKMAAQPSESSTRICGWLNQLRAVDANNFDSMARNCTIASLKYSGDNTALLTVVCALVASGCIRFDMVVSLAKEVNTPVAASSVIRLLCSSTIINGGLHPVEAYRFRVQQKRYRMGSAEKVIPLLIFAMEDPRIAIDDEGFHNMVMEYAVYKYTDCMTALREAQGTSAFLANCGRLVTKMLNLGRDTATPVSLDVKSIVALADPLSVVQCTGALAFLAKAGADNDGELLPAVLEAIANGCEVWPQLLEGASVQTIRGIYKWAKEQVFNNVSRHDSAEPLNREEFSRTLDILDVAHHAVKGEDANAVMTAITEKLKGLEPSLAGIAEAAVEQRQQAMFTLHVLLHITVLYSSSSMADSDVSKQGRCHLLAAVCVILLHPGLQSHQEVLEYIYDAASTLADTLPTEVLASLAQNMSRNGVHDPRLSMILGSASSPDAWLALVSQPLPQGSAQARALLNKAAAQQQLAGRGGHASPIQQTSSPQKAALRPDGRPLTDMKTMPFPLRRWEIMSDATPMVGDNDTSLSLSLFGARKV